LVDWAPLCKEERRNSMGSNISLGQPIDTRNVNEKKGLVQQITNSKLCKVLVHQGNLGQYFKPSP
jgi:hypothetical protein